MGDAPVKIVSEPRIIGDGTSAGPAADCKVAEYLVDALADAGVRHIFGVIGGSVLPTFVATLGSRTQLVMAKHEAGAAFMADGYARVRGGLGACIATSGPGATNLITGVASAYADSIPIVVLTGQVATKSFGKGAFQESSSEGIDIVDVFKGMTRYSTLLFRGDRLPDVWHKAMRMALGGRPGPVHLSVPADVQEQSIMIPPRTVAPVSPGHAHDRAAIKQAALHLLRARRPVILAGHGAILSNASDEIRAVAEMLEIPVATTPKGKGAFPEDHRLSVGPFGYSGSPLAQWHLLESGMDVLLAVGTSLSEWGTLGWDRRLQPSEALLHFDIDPYEIGKNYPVTVPVIGDAKSGLTELCYEIRRQQQRYLHWRRGNGKLAPPPERPRIPGRRGDGLGRGAHQASAPDEGPAGGAASGRSGVRRRWGEPVVGHPLLADPLPTDLLLRDRHGVDGLRGGGRDRREVRGSRPGRRLHRRGWGFLMNGMEVSTAVHYGKQVIWVVLNDGGYGMAHHALRHAEATRRGHALSACRLRESGGRSGGSGIPNPRARRDQPRADREILESGRPTLLDVEIDPDEVAPFGSRRR